MIPKINKQQQVTNYLKAHPQEAKPTPKTHKQKVWKQHFTLDSYTVPVAISDTRYKKKYKLRMLYTDTLTHKHHSHTVYFGTDSDFIQNHDESMRLKNILRLKQIHNPFSPDYWSAHFCNKKPTMRQAMDDFNEYLMQKSKQILQKRVK